MRLICWEITILVQQYMVNVLELANYQIHTLH